MGPLPPLHNARVPGTDPLEDPATPPGGGSQSLHLGSDFAENMSLPQTQSWGAGPAEPRRERRPGLKSGCLSLRPALATPKHSSDTISVC